MNNEKISDYFENWGIDELQWTQDESKVFAEQVMEITAEADAWLSSNDYPAGGGMDGRIIEAGNLIAFMADTSGRANDTYPFPGIVSDILITALREQVAVGYSEEEGGLRGTCVGWLEQAGETLLALSRKLSEPLH